MEYITISKYSDSYDIFFALESLSWRNFANSAEFIGISHEA